MRVDRSDRQETMTMSVVVPNEHDEGAVREFGIARAKDLARRFAELPSGNFQIEVPCRSADSYQQSRRSPGRFSRRRVT